MYKFISKFIPVSIEIHSLYWVRIYKLMDSDLRLIFNCIDVGEYNMAMTLIDRFHTKWDGRKYPKWVSRKHSQIHRAEAMLNVLTFPLDTNS